TRGSSMARPAKTQNKPNRIIEDLDAALQGRSKAELVALVKQMVKREPDLEPMVESPVPKAKGGRRAGAAVTSEDYERKAAEVFRRNSGGWDEYGYSDSGRQCADELRPILSTGDEFVGDRDFTAAVAVFVGVLNAVVEHFDEEFQDEEGSLGE